jgi:protein-S-isoprenylcysteine O-methyltransferase Ste14
MRSLLVRLALIIVGSVVFFLPAILVEGGFAAFFSHPPFVWLAIVSVVMFIAALFAGGNVSPGIQEDRSNRWVLVPFTLISVLAAFVPAWCDRNNFLTINSEAIRWLGVVLYTIGGALRLYPVFVLGNRFSGLVAIQSGHTLVTNGIYSVIRHPSYLGLIIIMFGWGLVFRSWIGILLALLVIPVLLGRITAEEALLHAHFGEEYERYRARTCRLIPGIY